MKEVVIYKFERIRSIAPYGNRGFGEKIINWKICVISKYDVSDCSTKKTGVWNSVSYNMKKYDYKRDCSKSDFLELWFWE